MSTAAWNVLLIVGTGCTALLALGALLRRVFRAIAKATALWERVENELTPNGGASTYDQVREIGHRLRNVELLLRLHAQATSHQESGRTRQRRESD